MGFLLVTCIWFLYDFRVRLLNFVNLSSLLLVLLGLDDDKEWFSLGDSLFLTVLGQVFFLFFYFFCGEITEHYNFKIFYHLLKQAFRCV